jgi:transposase
MGQNFIGCDRGQVMLLPPSLTDWLEEDHLVWTVLGAVDQMDLDAFYGAYRANGQGRAAYDPQMMVSLLLYAYCLGIRSSRRIERACRGDVAFKVITALEVPDHSTIAEFRRRHQDRLGELFIDVLALCAEAGLITLGEVAIDGTKMLANASLDRNRRYESIVEEILQQAEQIDREEDQLHGDARGDEPPPHLRTREQRREALAAARDRLQAERAAAQAAGEEVVPVVELELVPDRFVTRPEGRRAWHREGRRALETMRDAQARAVARDRPERIAEVKRRFDEELAYLHAADRCYEQHRATARSRDGKRWGNRGAAWETPLVPEGKINSTDPDSRVMVQRGYGTLQAYNAQAAVTTGQIIIAAEVTTAAPDFGQLEPVLRAARRDLEKAGVTGQPGAVLADTGYWHKGQMERIVAQGSVVLIPPDGGLRSDTRPGWDRGLYAFMRRVLATDQGRALYSIRKQTIEPVFGQIKGNRRLDRFLLRGRAAVRAEWRMIAATHNILKLHTHWTAPATG